MFTGEKKFDNEKLQFSIHDLIETNLNETHILNLITGCWNNEQDEPWFSTNFPIPINIVNKIIANKHYFSIKNPLYNSHIRLKNTESKNYIFFGTLENKLDINNKNTNRVFMKEDGWFVVDRENPIVVWGNGEDVRDFIYIEDFVDACITIMKKVDKYSIWNVGNGVATSVIEIVKLCQEIEMSWSDITYNRWAPTMIPIRLLDVNKMKTELGWEAKTNISEGLRKTIDWYKNVK